MKILSRYVSGIFLDLKFCDIPNTVAGAVAAAARLPKVRMLTLHATGGLKMLKAAKEALRGYKRPPKLLGVTILTSLAAEDLRRVGLSGSPATRALKLARLAQQARLDGVVASAGELRQLRRAFGRKFLLVVPGIRPTTKRAGGAREDQARVATPAEAIRLGADYLVVGRPITAAPDPAAATAAILQEMASAAGR